jgi:hypothetical protein
MNKKEIYMPLFPWFYGSWFSIYDNITEDDYESFNVKDFDEFEDKFNVDHKSYERDFWIEFLKLINRDFALEFFKLWIYNLKFKWIISPTYYNYWNDELNISVNYSLKRIIEFLKDNKKEFSIYIENQNKSRDGFIPFWQDNFFEYLKKIKENLEPFELSQILIFYLVNIKDFNQWVFLCDAYNNLNINDYIEKKPLI